MKQALLDQRRNSHHIWGDNEPERKEIRMATVKVDNSNFQADVLNAKEPVVVDFWRNGAAPAR